MVEMVLGAVSAKRAEYVQTAENSEDASVMTALVPYRRREKHLASLIDKLYQFSCTNKTIQRVNIVVVQQNDEHPFNAGAIRNVAFAEALHVGVCVEMVDNPEVPRDQVGHLCGRRQRSSGWYASPRSSQLC